MPGTWHTNWQNEVPADRREVKLGRRRADAVTLSGWVVEFQHSHISVEEVARREREYEVGVWVVDMSNRQSAPWWTVAASWKVFLDYGDHIRPQGTNLKLSRDWLVDFLNNGQNELTLNWRRAKPATGAYTPCTICGKTAHLLDPFDGNPKHRECAEDAITYGYDINTLL